MLNFYPISDALCLTIHLNGKQDQKSIDLALETKKKQRNKRNKRKEEKRKEKKKEKRKEYFWNQ